MIRRLAIALGLGAAATAAYNLVLVAAAARPSELPPDILDSSLPRLLVLVPAHDEQQSIAQTIDALHAADYPADRLAVVVIADNCSDTTAAIARAAGAEVLERFDDERRGKGQALAWALHRLADRDHQGVLMVDADCIVSPNLPRAVGTRLAGGHRAVQTDYVVSNPGESPNAGLRAAAFALACTARPAGRAAMGASAGLLGTGMGFSRALLAEQPWEAFSLAEDAEYHLRLADAGERVAFAREAAVHSPMPVSAAESEQQQSRWEAGRVALARKALPLAVRGLRERDRVKLHAGLEMLLAPQALLVAALGASGATALLLRSRVGVALAALGLGSQVAAVMGALRIAGAPPETYRALRGAPALVVSKLAVYGRIFGGRGPRDWRRTTRESS